MNRESISFVWRTRQAGEWYIWRERTTKPFAQIRSQATKLLFRGLAALSTVHNGVDRFSTSGVSGATEIPGWREALLPLGYDLTFGTPATFIPLLKSKILSEIASDTIELAGGNFFGSKDVFVIHGHNEATREQLKSLLQSFGRTRSCWLSKARGGMTIIEKFEYYANLCFCICCHDAR